MIGIAGEFASPATTDWTPAAVQISTRSFENFPAPECAIAGISVRISTAKTISHRIDFLLEMRLKFIVTSF